MTEFNSNQHSNQYSGQSLFNIELFISSNMIVVFATIIFCMITQTLFFKYVASKQFNTVLEDKANIVEQYLKHDEESNTLYKKFKSSESAKILKNAASQEEDIREKINMSNTMMWIGIPVIIGILFIIFFLARLYLNNETWDTVDTMLLCIVVISYITEIMFYVGIVRPYQFYGDQSLYSNIYDVINNNINKNPITPAGKHLQTKLDDMINTITKFKSIQSSTKNNHVSATCITSKAKQFYNKHKDTFNLNGVNNVNADFITTYAQKQTANISDIINFDVVNSIGKHTNWYKKTH